MSGQDHTGNEPVNARIFPIPPVVALLFITAGFGLGYAVPLADSGLATPLESKIAGALIMVCAAAIALLAMREMVRSRTTFHPGGSAMALVQSGIFKRTRNPMYLSLVLITLGLGVATANAWLVLLAPLLLIYLQERVVKREEAYLSARFGEDYIAYKRQVRRWF
ncbi:MAG: isoprenylcysteine carboxylmethyltransferase family protein [Rhodomicrobium sp.]|nr:isoprenylcysteine carboxylmethyltransferase family protein [Rhodomicrobium sp.]